MRDDGFDGRHVARETLVARIDGTKGPPRRFRWARRRGLGRMAFQALRLVKGGGGLGVAMGVVAGPASEVAGRLAGGFAPRHGGSPEAARPRAAARQRRAHAAV